MKFTPQRVKFLHSMDGVNYSLDFFFLRYRDIAMPLLPDNILRCGLLTLLSYCNSGSDGFNINGVTPFWFLTHDAT